MFSINIHDVFFQFASDLPSKGYQLKHRRGKSETVRAQYINTKDVRFGYYSRTLSMLA